MTGTGCKAERSKVGIWGNPLKITRGHHHQSPAETYCKALVTPNKNATLQFIKRQFVDQLLLSVAKCHSTISHCSGFRFGAIYRTLPAVVTYVAPSSAKSNGRSGLQHSERTT